MKRTHKKSKIVVLPEGCTGIDAYILQIEQLGNLTVVEYLEQNEALEYVNSADATPEKNIVDMEYENALTTVLNNDPRGKFSGKTLQEIFNDPSGKEWVEWALANMKNKFILERVRAIYEHNQRGLK